MDNLFLRKGKIIYVTHKIFKILVRMCVYTSKFLAIVPAFCAKNAQIPTLFKISHDREKIIC